jgi:signal transduction histidine kinase/ligand-binding sensor domain-containing protein
MCSVVTAQNAELKGGQFPIRELGPKDYKGSQEVLSIIEDDDGFVMFANQKGVSIFNGSSWQTVSLKKNAALWLTKDRSGQIFVGGEDDFGYLTKNDKLGTYSYQSLATLLPDSIQGYGSTWEVESTSYGTYFRSSRYLFWYFEGNLRVLPYQSFQGDTYDVISAINDTLFLRKRDVGIVKIIKDQMEVVPNGTAFSKVKTNAILSINGEIVIATRLNGLIPLSPNAKFNVSRELNQRLSKGQIYHATAKYGLIAIATLTDGVYILDNNGQLIEQISEESYGINSAIQFAYFDNLKRLWIGSLYGAVKVYIQQEIRIHPSINKNDHIIYDFERYNGNLFVGTQQGVYLIKDDDFHNAVKIDGINSGIYKLQVVDGHLLANGYGGTFMINDALKSRQLTIQSTLLPIADKPYYLGAYQEGLSLYKRVKEYDYQLVRKLDVPNNVHSVIEFDKNRFWAGSTSGLTYYDLATDSTFTFDELGTTSVFTIEGIPHFFGSKGVFSYEGERLKKSSKIYQHIDSSTFEISAIDVDSKGNLAILYHDAQLNVSGLFLQKSSDGYRKKLLPDLSLSTTDFSTIRLEENGHLWIGGNEQIYQLNLLTEVNTDPFSIRITRATAGNKTLDVSSRSTSMDFEDNQFEFEFGSLFLGTLGANKYQHFLQGIDKEWSTWSENSKLTYNYLPPGTYTLYVKGKNQHHVESEVASFSFVVLPPWYWSKLAILGYFIGFVALIIGITQLRYATLRRDKANLIKMVRERTEEILEKNKKLEEMDKMKTQFYSNISHEFRTPLTLILGPLENLKSADQKPSPQEYDSLIRNASKLLDLINEMLDLSKLEAKRMAINSSQHHLMDYLQNIHNAFLSMAKIKNIQFDLEMNHQLTELPFDKTHMDKILFNLLSNAFKFSKEKGRVLIKTEEKDNKLLISVTDSGIGIDQKDIDHIFDRFYQAHHEASNTSPGTGIGLSLVKELVQLHGGEIKVTSVPNEGSTFTVLLPINS